MSLLVSLIFLSAGFKNQNPEDLIALKTNYKMENGIFFVHINIYSLFYYI